jgi:hypothetical protein
MLLNFQKQFAPLIERDEKRQTIRQRRRDGKTPKPGETLHLYTGLRTHAARKLGERTVVECFPVHFDLEELGARVVVVNGIRLHVGEADAFARLDGFQNAQEMLGWFRKTYKTPAFDGFCVRWRSADTSEASRAHD